MFRSEFWEDVCKVNEKSSDAQIERVSNQIKRKIAKLGDGISCTDIAVSDYGISHCKIRIPMSLIKSEHDIPAMSSWEIVELIDSDEFSASFDDQVSSLLLPYIDMARDVTAWGAGPSKASSAFDVEFKISLS